MQQPVPQIFDRYPDPTLIGLIVLSPQGKVLDSNEKASRILGCSRADLFGTYLSDILLPEGNRASDPLQQLFDGEIHHFHGRQRFRCERTRIIHAQVSMQAVFLEESKQIDHLLVFLDSSSEALQLQSIQASQLASLGELTAGVAHEINNPISGVINYAQILRNRLGEQEELRKFSDLIIKEGSRVAAIVKDMLFFVGNQSNKQVLTTVVELVEHTLTLVRWQLERDGIKLKVDVPGSLPLLRVNFQELQQLLLNLIKNAHYALDKKPSETENDKWLKISAVTIDNETGPAIRLSVADNGIGIPPEILDRVLNPFVTTKPAGSGTGLGLSLGHDIVKRHGGQIQIESEHHIGTQVLVDLPLPKKRP